MKALILPAADKGFVGGGPETPRLGIVPASALILPAADKGFADVGTETSRLGIVPASALILPAADWASPAWAQRRAAWA